MNAKRVIQFIALILTLVLLLGVIGLMTQKSSPLYQPIKNYQLLSATHQVSQTEVDSAIEPYLGLSFWEIPLTKIQADLTRLDWIKNAEVKRQWPNTLYVYINEQKPVARWNDDGLINGYGEVFFPQAFNGYENLVRLEGELEDSSAVLQQLIVWQTQFDQLDMLIARLSYFNKVWRISVLDGPDIVVDSQAKEEKILRFVRAFPQLDKTLRKSARSYDLRYSNGFIVANTETP